MIEGKKPCADQDCYLYWFSTPAFHIKFIRAPPLDSGDIANCVFEWPAGDADTLESFSKSSFYQAACFLSLLSSSCYLTPISLSEWLIGDVALLSSFSSVASVAILKATLGGWKGWRHLLSVSSQPSTWAGSWASSKPSLVLCLLSTCYYLTDGKHLKIFLS